jgi:hypothetical protein
VGPTALTLAAAAARPEVRAAAAPSLPVGGSWAGAATVLALHKQVVPLFSAEEANLSAAFSRWREGGLSSRAPPGC